MAGELNQARRKLQRVLTLNPGGLEHGGGIGRMIGYMMTAWHGREDEPQFTVIDTRGPGRLDWALGYFGLALVRIISAAWRRPLLHVHVAGRGSTLRKVIVVHLGAALRLPIVLHLHDYDYAAFLAALPGWALGPVRSMFRRADAVVVLGKGDRETAISILGVQPDRVVIVPNAVPKPTLAALKEFQTDGVVTVAFLGDPSRRKGVHDLLEAFNAPSLAADDAPSWRAVIAGGGKELEGFREDAVRAGLDDRVSFPGWLSLDGARALLDRCDILVLPSYHEGLAMSVLEGMSFQKCVICTPVGALAEVVIDQVSGLLIEPGDVPALTAALRRCIDDPELRRELGEGAFTRFCETYDAALYPARIGAVYELAQLRQSATQ